MLLGCQLSTLAISSSQILAETFTALHCLHLKRAALRSSLCLFLPHLHLFICLQCMSTFYNCMLCMLQLSFYLSKLGGNRCTFSPVKRSTTCCTTLPKALHSTTVFQAFGPLIAAM